MGTVARTTGGYFADPGVKDVADATRPEWRGFHGRAGNSRSLSRTSVADTEMAALADANQDFSSEAQHAVLD